MSWEVINTKKIKCLCGKGTIEQNIIGDDWNRIESETPTIKCKECSSKYELTSKNYYPKPKHDYTLYFLKNKETGEEIQLDL